MKTLDEVIKAMECCISGVPCAGVCPYYDNDCLEHDMENDALFYLREYKDMKQKIEAMKEDAIEAECKYHEAEEKLEAQRLQMMWVDKHFKFEEPNDPLAWDELKEMVGKPVWVEEFFPVMEDETGATEDEGRYDKYWAIIDNVKAKKIFITWRNGNFQSLSLNRMGEYWQAYRKERTE